MAWEEPKTNWQASDVVTANDFNRIEGNIQELQNTKETPAGAQAKAEAALAAAKQYTDQEVGEVSQALAAHQADDVAHGRDRVRGSWEDTSTVIGAGQTYTKTIPLGIVPNRVRIVALGYNSKGLNGFVDIDGEFVRFVSSYLSGSSSTILQIGPSESLYSGTIFGNSLSTGTTGIKMTNARIEGKNLVLIFTNTSDVELTLHVAKLYWEVGY